MSFAISEKQRLECFFEQAEDNLNSDNHVFIDSSDENIRSIKDMCHHTAMVAAISVRLSLSLDPVLIFSVRGQCKYDYIKRKMVCL